MNIETVKQTYELQATGHSSIGKISDVLQEENANTHYCTVHK